MYCRRGFKITSGNKTKFLRLKITSKDSEGGQGQEPGAEWHYLQRERIEDSVGFAYMAWVRHGQIVGQTLKLDENDYLLGLAKTYIIGGTPRTYAIKTQAVIDN